MDDRIQADQARHQRQRDARSDALDREVNTEIAARAERRDVALAADVEEADRLATQAGKLDRLELDQREAAAATATAEASASARARSRAVERDRQVSGISRVVTYLFSLVYGLLLIRIVLALLGASPSTPFVGLVHAMARPRASDGRSKRRSTGTAPGGPHRSGSGGDAGKRVRGTIG